MRSFTIALFLILAAPALVFLTGGCGSGGTTAPGSGGGGVVIAGPTDADFVGGYFWNLWGGDVAGPTNTAQWGVVTGDGAGMINAGLIAQNLGGFVSGPIAIPPLPYSVGANGRMQLTVGGATMEGGISEDGSLLGLAQVTAGVNPSVAIIPRGTGVWSDADVSGDYHVSAFFWNGANEVTWWGGTATFDGAGTVTGLSVGTNINGAVNPPGAPLAFGTYTVAASGLMSWAMPATTVGGGIGLDGELIVLSGNTVATDTQILVVLIKKGAGLNEATFSGTYHFVALQGLNAPPPAYGSITGTSTSDGAGSWALNAFTQNRDGVITNAPGAGGTGYTVAADGELDVPGPDYRGAVSESGRVAMVAGPYTGGSPLFIFMFR